MEKPKLHVVSLSGGKDSTAMLLRMLEEEMPVDIILFCDTGMEGCITISIGWRHTPADRSPGLNPSSPLNI